MDFNFDDPDGDNLSFSGEIQYPGVVTLRQKTNSHLVLEAVNLGTSEVYFTVNDAFGGSITKTFTFTVGDQQTFSIPERSVGGTLVGSPVAAIAPEGETLSYSLTGEASDSGHFQIDSATGQISVKQGATADAIDYETKDSYTGKVEYSTTAGNGAINVTINVEDLEAGKPAAPTVARAEFSEETAPALDVNWTRPDNNGLTISWYALQYRKQGATEWTNFDDHVLETTSARLSDLEAGATYEVQVRAGTNEEGLGPWSATREATANTPPQVTSAFIVDNDAIWGHVYLTPIDGNFQDADNDSLTYVASAEYPGVADVWLEGTSLGLRALNPAATEVTYGVLDGYGGYASRTYTTTGVAHETRSVAENSPGGTHVGRNLGGLPYDDGDDSTNDTLTHTLHGDATAVFDIDASTGQLSVKQGASLDYETTSSYAGQVKWTVQGQPAVINLTVNLTDVAAGQPGTPTVTRTEFTEQTAPALDVAWTAAAANGFNITGYEVQYRVKVAQGETANSWTLHKFDDPANPGTKISLLPATARTANLPDLTPGATYEVQVRARTDDTATNGEDVGPWSDTGEGMANRPPVSAGWDILDNSIPWGSGSISQLTMPEYFTDSDGDTLNYAAFSEYPGMVGAWLWGDPPRIGVRAHNPGSATITYAARDAYGGHLNLTFKTTGLANETRSVAENSPAGTHVGRHLGGTPYDDGNDETDDTLTHTMTGEVAESGLFALDTTTGQLSVAEGATLDHETESSYTGQVHFEVQGQPALINLTVNVTDIEATAASAPTLTRTEFSEPTAPALDVTWTAANDNGLTITGYNVQYREKGVTEWTAYTVDDGNGGETANLPATVRTVNLPDLTAGATYEAQVRALTDATTNGEDVGPWSDTGEGRANTPPSASEAPFLGDSFPVGSIADYRETGQGELGYFFQDADSDALTYSASAEHPALLGVSLSGAAGEAHLQVTLLNPGASEVYYVARDPYGGEFTRTVTITATPKTETRSVAERSAAGTLVGDPVTGTPYDDGDDATNDALSYTLSDGNSEDVEDLFVIDPATGQISVAEGAALDYETKSSYTGIVSYTVDGHAATINLTINVTDVEGTIPNAPAVTRTEFSEQSSPALDVTWTEADANGLTVTEYEVQYRVKVAEGKTENAWTLYKYSYTDPEDQTEKETSRLPATVRTVNLPGPGRRARPTRRR